jgi:CheY-like chemotaxis protein
MLMQNEDGLSGTELERESTVAQKNPPRRILVVDADPDTRQLSVDVLVNSDFEVDAVVDGAVAWEALQARHFDLVITDNKMPGYEPIAKPGIPAPAMAAAGGNIAKTILQ